MIDKTKEEILRDEINHDDIIEGVNPRLATSFTNVLDAMQAYADQEKRKEILAFEKWTGENGYIRFSDGRLRYSKGFASFATDHLYDLFIQSLQPNTQ